MRNFDGIKQINLNFGWKYSPSFKEEYLKSKYKDEDFQLVNIPHTNIELPYNNFDESMYCFTSTYIKEIFIDQNLLSKCLILRFDGCATYAEVYVNGKKVGEHKGGYTGFKFDISSHVAYGAYNTILVKLDSSEREEIPPFGNVIDYLTYGGIYREVYLDIFERAYIDEIFITPSKVLSDSPKVKFQFKLKNAEKNKKIQISIKDMVGKEIAREELGTNGTEREEIELKVKDIKLWDIDNPYLYTATIEYNKNIYERKFGFREAIFKRRGFYLNGRRIKLRGLNRHQAYPFVGYAMPKSAQVADADFLKYELGLNIARTSHYPQSQHFLNRCDEIGLLVFTEIPGWQHIGEKGEWWDITLRHVEEMITQNFNHPSIILWGVRINESINNNELYKQTNELARKLDPSRQTGGVRYLPHSGFLEDVYTLNDFTHAGGKSVLLPKWIASGPVPYLVTEYNGHMFPTKSFDHEKKRQEHALRHARVLNAMYKMRGLSGCIGWCMSDYNTHKDFGSGDKICYHGVSDMFRIKKLAGYVYAAQQDKKPVLEITSNMEIGDVAGGQVGEVFIITNCDKVVLSKNGEEIVEFDIKEKAKKSKTKYMPHPIIKLDDVIGNQIEKDGRFSKRDAKTLKKILLRFQEKGVASTILRYPLTILHIMSKYKINVQEFQNLYGQFVQSWGGTQMDYMFEGYINGNKVITTTKGSVKSVHLHVKSDSNKLIEKETYDTTRIVIKALSQLNNVLPYANDSLKITTEGPIELIGPSVVPLVGGVRGVWVKTTGETGQGKVLIECESLKQKREVIIDVEKIQLEN